MNRFPLICAVFLIGCADRAPIAVIRPVVPAELRRQVVVTCREGATVRALGECALAKAAGLDEANSKIAAIDAILSESGARR